MIINMLVYVLSYVSKEDKSLLKRGSEQEVRLLRMYERMYTATEQLSFPMPSGRVAHILWIKIIGI